LPPYHVQKDFITTIQDNTVKNIVTIIGARPQFIKAAPVGQALREQDDIKHTVIHTGQHFDHNMSDIFFHDFGMPFPQYNLNIHEKTHGALTGKILKKLDEILPSLHPDIVIVYGDTDTTLAGCLSAVKMHIPVAHIEAGLRSFNRKMPEEINRVLTDHASTVLFCPTQVAIDNLANEGIHNTHLVGDVMYDLCLAAVKIAVEKSSIIKDLSLNKEQYSVATVHRAENTNSIESLTKVIHYLKEQASCATLILPLHPRTKIAAENYGVNFDNIRTIEPVGYFDMIQLVKNASTVFTDSGGLQKEAFFLGTPCVTLREETEWVETIQSGYNRLWTSPNYLPRQEVSPYGNGTASQAIVEILLRSPE